MSHLKNIDVLKKSRSVVLLGVSLLLLSFYACKESVKKEVSGTESGSVTKAKEVKIATDQPESGITIDVSRINSATDINDVVSAVKAEVAKVESVLPKLQKKEMKLNIFNTPNTPVTVWYDGNDPVKVTFGVIDDSGAFDGVFTYYLKQAKPWFSDQIFAKYIFQNGKLKYWMDENWNVNDIPEKDFKDNEKRLFDNVSDLLEKIK